MNTLREYYEWAAIGCVAILITGIVADRSPILSVDGRYTQWNLAAYCGEAYPDVPARCR